MTTLPAIAARGALTIDGVQFTADPTDYAPYRWPKRASIHEGLGGSVTVQDCGVFARDRVLTLSSGATGLLHADVVAALDAKYRTKGATYTLIDWLGNEFTVFLTRFEPVAGPTPNLYAYTLECRVMAITKLFGATYTGS